MPFCVTLSITIEEPSERPPMNILLLYQSIIGSDFALQVSYKESAYRDDSLDPARVPIPVALPPIMYFQQ